MGMVKDDPTFLQRCLNRPPHNSSKQPSALCIGIGGGSLPLFLSHHFPGMRVEAIDLDPAVLAAASQAMGFPLDRCTAAQVGSLPACEQLLFLAHKPVVPCFPTANRSYYVSKSSRITGGQGLWICLYDLEVCSMSIVCFY